MEAKHTPGPWDNIADRGFIIASNNRVVCQMWSKHEDDFDNHEANAALIAAAPDLLSALRQMRSTLGMIDVSEGDLGDAEEAMRIAATAIAKAEGRE